MASAFRLVTKGPILQQSRSIYQQQILPSSRVARFITSSQYHSQRSVQETRGVARVEPRSHNLQCLSRDRLPFSSQARTPVLWQARSFSVSTLHKNETDTSGRNVDAKKSSPTESLTPDTPMSSSPKAVPQILQSITPPVLHENIYTLPNFLTTTRIITAPVICYALVTSQPVLAFGLFAYSSITDLVDGWLARRFKSGTVLGSILDPFADKLLMTLTTISLYVIGTFPWWLALIILGRDAGLLLSALYFRWISLQPPRTMKRYWDFSLPSAEVRPTEISKINTMLQFLLVANALLLPALPVGIVDAWNLWGIFEGWMGLVAGTTIWSGLSYIFTKDAIKFLGPDGKEVPRGGR